MQKDSLLNLNTEKTISESQGSALTFAWVQFFYDIPVGSTKVGNMLRRGKAFIFVMYFAVEVDVLNCNVLAFVTNVQVDCCLKWVHYKCCEV